MVNGYLDGGLEAVHKLAADRVDRNRSLNHESRPFPAPPPRVIQSTMTIEDVSVDGTFPAEGYQTRMRSWARAIAAERA